MYRSQDENKPLISNSGRNLVAFPFISNAEFENNIVITKEHLSLLSFHCRMNPTEVKKISKRNRLLFIQFCFDENIDLFANLNELNFDASSVESNAVSENMFYDCS